MEEIINPLSNNNIQDIIETAQALIGRSTLALEREYPRSRLKKLNSNVYILKEKGASIIWIPNIFDVCDISIVQFETPIDIENCCNFCNETMEKIKPKVLVGRDTIVQNYTEKISGQNNFLIGWKYSSILR